MFAMPTVVSKQFKTISIQITTFQTITVQQIGLATHQILKALLKYIQFGHPLATIKSMANVCLFNTIIHYFQESKYS